MKKMLMMVGLCVMLAQGAWAESVADENGAKELVSKVMANVEKADLLSAFATIKPYMPVTSADFDKMALQYKTVIEQYLTKYGNPTAVIFIDSKKIGESVMRVRYIETNDKYAHTWSFYFHKIKDGWVINSFNWDDSIQKLFES